MEASVKVTPDHDMPSLVRAAGGNPEDRESFCYRRGALYVKDVTQEALDQAVADYDPAAAEATKARAELAATDSGMARMAEDIVDALVTKGIIALTDLPQSAQDRINSRAALRAKIT
jgi:hypothetical protein